MHNLHRKLILGGVTCVAAALVLVTTFSTAAVAEQAKPALKCAALLTADELTTIIGEKMTDMGARERGPGETECPWMLRGGSGGFKTLSVQFYESAAIKATPTAPTPDKYFEMVVAAAEGSASGKREMLTGIAEKAAFVPASPQVLAVVQRADGIARIVGNNLTKAQITAVAKAVATP